MKNVLLTLFALFVALCAKAETVIYKGMLDHQTLTLQIEVNPSAPFFITADYCQETIDSSCDLPPGEIAAYHFEGQVGSAKLSYAGASETDKLSLFAEASRSTKGLLNGKYNLNWYIEQKEPNAGIAFDLDTSMNGSPYVEASVENNKVTEMNFPKNWVVYYQKQNKKTGSWDGPLLSTFLKKQ